MELKLERFFFGVTYTVGRLYINGVYFCDTIEDANRDLDKNGKFDNGEVKIKHKTCIPFGIRKIIVNMSTRFKRLLPRILNVPDFDGILIHNGVDETSSSGCIIVGINSKKGKVTNSRHYMNLLTDILIIAQDKGEEITIETI